MKICNVSFFLTSFLSYYSSAVAIATSDNNSTAYPGSTADVPVRQIHSHNDYWRKRPFYDAVERGVQSIEADVWLLNENDTTLYVGHNPYSLKEERTFDSLYIQPILETLNKLNNPIYHLPEVNNSGEFNKDLNGVFQTNAGATLYLFVDVKNNGSTAWPKVVEALQPLREKNYLTDFNGTAITYRPVTVIGTGETPLDYLLEHNSRDYFFDAPLYGLNNTFTATLSPIASADFQGTVGKPGLDGLNDTAIEILESQIEYAHSLGIKTRYWNIPDWPVRTRNAIWTQIANADGDFLLTDDLDGAIQF